MAEEEKIHGEDEYQFTEGLAAGEKVFTTSTEAAAAHGSYMTVVRKLVLVVIAGFLVITVIYKFASSFWGGKEIEKSPPAKPAVTVIAPVRTVQEPIVRQPTADTSQTQQLHQRINQLQSSVEQSRADTNRLLDSMSGLQQNIELLNQRFAKMDDPLKSMALQLNLQQEQIDLLEKRTRKPVVKRVAHKKPPLKKPDPVFYIQAIIPGRAWLKSTEGTTLTVGEGDRLRSYGAISEIDAASGRITTSYGRIITFSPEDS